MNGRGIEKYANGDSYEGAFRKGKAHDKRKPSTVSFSSYTVGCKCSWDESKTSLFLQREVHVFGWLSIPRNIHRRRHGESERPTCFSYWLSSHTTTTTICIFSPEKAFSCLAQLWSNPSARSRVRVRVCRVIVQKAHFLLILSQVGKGKLTSANGEELIGMFKDDAANGRGVKTWPDGRKYEGDWVDGQPCGQGTLTTGRGVKYMGEWKNGMQHGYGDLTYSDGKRYMGYFLKGELSGQGKMKRPPPSTWKYDGEWKEGKMWGDGVIKVDGETYEGTWEKGKQVAGRMCDI